MRILHVNDLPPGPSGGAEVHVGRLVAAQRAAGHEVEVFFQAEARRVLARWRDVWDPAARRRLQEAAAAQAPDVVHLHNVVRELSPSVVGATGRPTVMTVHDLRAFGGSEHRWPDPRAVAGALLVEPMTRRIVRRHALTLIAVSETVAARLACFGMTARVVPVPVPPPIVTPLPAEDCADVLFVGRLTRDKGAHVAVEAFLAVAGRHPGSRLVVVGAGPERTALERQADGHSQVVFSGSVDETGVSRAMGRARVVVTPSIPSLRPEGSSIVTVEAARHGRPVVTSDDPAVAEVAEIVGGDVVPAGDAEALARKLDRWLSDPEAAADAGRRGAEAATNRYDPERVGKQIEHIYEQAVSGAERWKTPC